MPGQAHKLAIKQRLKIVRTELTEKSSWERGVLGPIGKTVKTEVTFVSKSTPPGDAHGYQER